MVYIVLLLFYLAIGGAVIAGMQLLPERYRGRATKIAAAGVVCVYVLMAFFLGTFAAGLDANIYFGSGNRALVDACVTGLEAGKSEEVLAALKRLQKDYRPTYENRADWDVLVDRAVGGINGELPDTVNPTE